MVIHENDLGLEIISVKIDNKVRGTYEGLSGTFASFVYCCLDKKVLPGFHEAGLIAGAELKDSGLLLVLSGKHRRNQINGSYGYCLTQYRSTPESRRQGGMVH